METIVNYYHLTKKELEFITSCERPICSSINGRRLTRPVVFKINSRTKEVINVMTLGYYRWCVKYNYLSKGFEYSIRAMY